MTAGPARSRRSRVHALLGTGLAAAAVIAGSLLLTARSAEALTVTVPVDVPRSMDVTATMSAADPTGTILLVVDGRAVRSAQASSGVEVPFTGVTMTPGYHRVRATLRAPAGTVRSDEQVTVRVWGLPGRPTLLNPPNGYAGKSVSVRIRAGSSTSSMTLTVNGHHVKSVACAPGAAVAFGTVALPKGTSTFVVTSDNPFGERAAYTYRVKRIIWPWATCIIIDKSQFKLYWVRNGVLVKVYPIAHGKPSTPTPSRVWKILSKERTDPHGVYGPRKLRLYKRSGSGWARTNFGIHGTNEPWVIGTRASHGCIRLYNRDILELWPQVPYGTMVQTRE